MARGRLGARLGLVDESRSALLWVTHFPLVEWNEEEGKWDPAHHMFTMPQDRYLETLEEDPGAVKGDLYDLVMGEVERPLFKAVMDYTDGNQSQAAGILGINRGTLRKKLKTYSLIH